MQYAIVPIENKDHLSWTYAIPVGSWIIPRIEADSSQKIYLGLETEIFNADQANEIESQGGIAFTDCDCFFAWRDQYGMIGFDE